MDFFYKFRNVRTEPKLWFSCVFDPSLCIIAPYWGSQTAIASILTKACLKVLQQYFNKKCVNLNVFSSLKLSYCFYFVQKLFRSNKNSVVRSDLSVGERQRNDTGFSFSGFQKVANFPKWESQKTEHPSVVVTAKRKRVTGKLFCNFLSQWGVAEVQNQEFHIWALFKEM